MVAMGFTQIYGVDYYDTFASVQNSRTFRIFLSFYNNNLDTRMEHWDIKSAFVNAPLEEEVYVHPVKGFEREGKEGKFLKHEASSTRMAETRKRHFFFSGCKTK